MYTLNVKLIRGTKISGDYSTWVSETDNSVRGIERRGTLCSKIPVVSCSSKVMEIS